MNRLEQARQAYRAAADELEKLLNADNLTSEQAQRMEALTDELPELRAKVERLEEAQRALEAARSVQDNRSGAAPDARDGEGGDDVRGGSSRVEGMIDREVERGFSTVGDQLMALVRAGSPDHRASDLDIRRLRHLNATEGRTLDDGLGEYRAPTGASTFSPADGGVFIQTQFDQQLLRRTYEDGQIISRCRRIGLGQGNRTLKVRGLKDDKRTDGNRFGGVIVYWTAEGDQIQASRPKFRTLEWNVNKMAAAMYATDEMLESAQALTDIVSEVFPAEMRHELEYAILYGNGAGKPLGALDSAANAKVTVAAESGQAADTVVWENIAKMYARMYAGGRQNGAWTINGDVWPELITMEDGAGNPIVHQSLQDAAGNLTLLGRPVLDIEHNPALGDEGDLQFHDFSQYWLVDKGAVNVASSIHVRFLYDEQVFKFTYEVDGRTTWEQVTTRKNGLSRAPHIVLAERS